MRRDSLPEFNHYKDKGCDVHPACLSCPLPECKYEHRIDNRLADRVRRDKQILKDRERGMTVAAIARKLHMGERTVFRAIKRGAAPESMDPDDKPGKPWNPDALPAGIKPRKELPSLKV